MFSNGIPDHDEWENVRKLSLFLQHFNDLTVQISGSLYVTSNIYFDEICEVYSTLLEWLMNHDPEFSLMASKMKEKHDKYWGNVEKMNMLLYVACVLDPQYKYAYVDFNFKKMYSNDQASILSEKLRKTMTELFNEYKRLCQPSLTQSESGQSTQQSGTSNVGIENDYDVQKKGEEKQA